jgi:long-subunit acyl-CoA synthetase (AMP-forming)
METVTASAQPRAGTAAASAATATGRARNAVALFAAQVASSGSRAALRYKQGGTWRTLTWNDWDRAAREVAAGLIGLGVKKGDRVCLLANTRYEWCVCDIGILMAGAVTVPIYQSNTPEQCEYIISDCGARAVIVDDPVQVEPQDWDGRDRRLLRRPRHAREARRQGTRRAAARLDRQGRRQELVGLAR